MAGYTLAAPIKRVDHVRLVFEEPVHFGPGSGHVRLCYGTAPSGERPTNSVEVRATVSDETRRKVLRLIRDDLIAQALLQALLPAMGTEEA